MIVSLETCEHAAVDFVCLSVCLDMGPVFIYEQIPAADGRAYVRAYIHTYIHT